jgi:hypothetical protein
MITSGVKLLRFFQNFPRTILYAKSTALAALLQDMDNAKGYFNFIEV